MALFGNTTNINSAGGTFNSTPGLINPGANFSGINYTQGQKSNLGTGLNLNSLASPSPGMVPGSVTNTQDSPLLNAAKSAAQAQGLIPSINPAQRGTTLGTGPQNSTGQGGAPNLNVGAVQPIQGATGTNAAVQTGNPSLPSYMQNLSPAQFGQATGAQQQGGGVGGFGGLLNNSSNQNYLQGLTDTYTKLAALQQQLAQANVPSSGELALNAPIFQAQSALANLNPQQYLKDNPALQAGGITQGQLQNTVAQSGVPIQQALSQALLNKSFMAQQRQIDATNLGAQATGLEAQGNIAQQLHQATMFGGLPPDLASAIIQKELFPPYQVYTGITGQPGVVSEGPGGSFNAQSLSGGGGIGGGTGAGGYGGLMDGSGQAFNPMTSTSINVAGLPAQVDHMADGTPYVQETKLDARIADYAKSILPSEGIPVLSEQNVGKIQNIDVTKQNLAQLGSLLPQILQGGLYGRTLGAFGNLISEQTQSDPNIAAFKVYRDTAINTIQALAGGTGSGFRLNQSEINTATSNLPSITDNLETAQQKLSLLNGFLQKWENEILPQNNAQAGSQTGGTQSGGQGGGGSLYSW